MFEEEKKSEDPADLAMTMAPPKKPLPVEIRNLTFSYDGEKKNIVDLNCVVEPNSKVILVGGEPSLRYSDTYLLICVLNSPPLVQPMARASQPFCAFSRARSSWA